jgi:hypothetical protein
MFTGDDSIVRYHYANLVLEYENFGFIPNDTLQCLPSSFALALNVLSRDETLTNEVYLSGYTKQTLGYTFYLDTAVNDYPIMFGRELNRAVTGMENYIVITVAKNHIHYSRFAVTFTLTDATEKATMDHNRFTTVHLPSFAGFHVTAENERTLRLGYIANLGHDNRLSPEMRLHWSITTPDGIATNANATG